VTYTKIIHDVATGEITEVELTAAEIKKVEKAQAEGIAEQSAAAAVKAKAEADKAALLARLGLTEDELKTILG
jgi:hypothetical protein